MADQQPDPLRTYAEARKEFDKVSMALRHVAHRMERLSSYLNRDVVHPSERSYDSLLNQKIDRPKASFDFADWPSKEDIESMMDRYYEALSKLKNAADQLSDDDRKTQGLSRRYDR